jgi:LPS sulfotransferase NodH
MILQNHPSGISELLASIKAEAGRDAFVSTKPISRRNYVICMLPRTGSTMLCSVLEKTGHLGYPDEYLNPRGVLQFHANTYCPSDILEYFDVLRRERSTPNGIFGLKVTFDDFRPIIDSFLIRQLLSPVQFIYLEREDLVLQAVSAVVAQQSGIWHRDAAGAPYQSMAIAEPTFDEPAIIAKLDEYAQMRAGWERFFAIHSIMPLRFTYERIVANIDEAVSQVAHAMGVDLKTHVDLSMSTTSRLADQRNYEWAERIRRKHRAQIEVV